MQKYWPSELLEELVCNDSDLIKPGCGVMKQRGEPGSKSWEAIEVTGAMGMETLSYLAEHLGRGGVLDS